MTDEELKIAQKKFVGNRVRLEKSDGFTIEGDCYFLGYSKHFPAYELQVTIARMPCTNIKLSELKLSPLRKPWIKNKLEKSKI